ncbi:STAS domain-containing protein [Blastococcus sp. SYSU D00820]
MPDTPTARTTPEARRLLTVTTRRSRRPGRVVVDVAGEVDSWTIPALEICLQSQTGRPQVREVVVDLGQMTFLGAAGVGVLARAHRRARARGARFAVRTGGRRQVLRPLQLTGLADVVPVDPADVLRPRASGPRPSQVRRPGRRHRRIRQ